MFLSVSLPGIPTYRTIEHYMAVFSYFFQLFWGGETLIFLQYDYLFNSLLVMLLFIHKNTSITRHT